MSKLKYIRVVVSDSFEICCLLQKSDKHFIVLNYLCKSYKRYSQLVLSDCKMFSYLLDKYTLASKELKLKALGNEDPKEVFVVVHIWY